jgi:hypothetical protein
MHRFNADAAKTDDEELPADDADSEKDGQS